MLETAVALVFAHLLADFVLQTDSMVRDKRRPPVLLGHVGIVAAASWVALGFAPVPLLLLLVGVSHFAIDARSCAGWRAGALEPASPPSPPTRPPTSRSSGSPRRSGPAPGPPASGPAPALRLPLARLPEAMALAAGLIATVWAGGYAVQELMSGPEAAADPKPTPACPRAAS